MHDDQHNQNTGAQPSSSSQQPGGGPQPYPHGPQSQQGQYGQPQNPQQQGYPYNRPPQQQPGYGGNQPYQAPQQYYHKPKPFSGKAIASMVLASAGLFLMPLGLLTCIPGAILGLLGMREAREPGGTHSGRGLAIGGLIASILIFLANLVVVGAVIAVIVAVEEGREEIVAEGQRVSVETDLELIHERLQKYYEIHGSLAPGGPVLRDGETRYDASTHPRVAGKLAVDDLVRESQLMGELSDYELVLIDDHACEIRARKAGKMVKLRNVLYDDFEIQDAE